jgi:hypothetical protein
VLTAVSNTVAAVVVPEPSRHRELVGRDQGYIGARAASGAGRVLEGGFKRRAVFPIELAVSSLEICNRGGERTVLGIVAASGKDPPALNERRLKSRGLVSHQGIWWAYLNSQFHGHTCW